jgi:hypothetical protein
MIDQEARRRLLDAQNQADAAAASRDLARESVHRLQQEVSIAATIASETLAILAKLDPWSVSRSRNQSCLTTRSTKTTAISRISPIF